MQKNSKKEYLTITVFAVYMILLVWLILFKFSTNIEQLSHIRNINLFPYGASMVVNGKIQFTEIIYNVIVFIPLGGVLGILLFLLLKKIFKKHTVTIVNIIGMVVEIAAIILITVILLANS